MQTIVERYLAAWNETETDRRTSLLRDVFVESATYQDPLMRGTGRDEIDGLIAAVHARFPGFVFRPAGTVDAVGDHLRFSWTLGRAGAAPVAGGTDFARVEDDRLTSVVGFLNPVEKA